MKEFNRRLVVKKYRYMNPGIESTEWGTRDVCVVDPSGNQLIFSERLA